MRAICCVLLILLARFQAVAEDPPVIKAASLAPSLTELVFALGLGDRLAGRSSACDFPPEAMAIPVLGDFGRPNQEALLATHPDLVLATDLEKPGLRGYLEGLGIKAMVLPCDNWADLLEAGRVISRELGDAEAGIRWASQMEARRTDIGQRVTAFYGSGPRPTVYLEIWSDPPMTAGRESFANDLVALAGGRNIGAELDRSYANVSSEWILAQDPDVIVLAYMTTNAAAERLAQRPGWDRLRAIREGRVCASINPDWLLRPGPRMLDGAEALAEWLMQQDRADEQEATE